MKKHTRKTNYKEKGITLVALVVTIIVLLILAGVTINLALGQNGLLQKAQFASNTMANATSNETTQLQQYANEIDELASGFGDSNMNFDTYIEGEEVTIGTEHFIVMRDSNETEENVRLIAKEWVDFSNMNSIIQSSSAQGCQFSETMYWIAETNNDTGDVVYYREPFDGDLTTDRNIQANEGKTALYIAQEYGKQIGAIYGTLAVEGEIRNSQQLKNVINSLAEDSTKNETFWLGYCTNNGNMFTDNPGAVGIVLDGPWWGGDRDSHDLSEEKGPMNFNEIAGVRPVVLVSKSLVEKVN